MVPGRDRLVGQPRKVPKRGDLDDDLPRKVPGKIVVMEFCFCPPACL